MVFVLAFAGGLSFVSFAQEHRTSTLSLAVDRDQDGLSNKEEELYGTNPDQRDTDGDGYSDGVEVESGYDPLVPASQGDRLIGIGNVHTVSGQEIAQSRQLTNELRTRVAGIAFDVMKGKEVSLDDIDKEMGTLLDGANILKNMPDVDVHNIRIKRQDYGDMNAKDRKRQVKKDITDYLTAVSYIMALYAPQPIKSTKDIDAFAQQLVTETGKLEDDYTNVTYFKKLLPRGEKLLREMNNIEVPEVMLPLHVEGLQLAQAAITAGQSFENISPDDPASAIVILSQMQALMSAASIFSEKLNEQVTQYGITI